LPDIELTLLELLLCGMPPMNVFMKEDLLLLAAEMLKDVFVLEERKLFELISIF